MEKERCEIVGVKGVKFEFLGASITLDVSVEALDGAARGVAVAAVSEAISGAVLLLLRRAGIVRRERL